MEEFGIPQSASPLRVFGDFLIWPVRAFEENAQYPNFSRAICKFLLALGVIVGAGLGGAVFANWQKSDSPLQYIGANSLFLLLKYLSYGLSYRVITALKKWVYSRLSFDDSQFPYRPLVYPFLALAAVDLTTLFIFLVMFLIYIGQIVLT